MIIECNGDILHAPADVLVNPVNTVGVMGKGLALQFKLAYPEMFAEYLAACCNGSLRVGRVMAHKTDEFPYIISFPTKRHWRDPSRLEWIRLGLIHLRATICGLDVRSVAVPPLGCGLGGLNWGDVRKLIREEMGSLSTVDLLLYGPSPTSRVG